MESKKEYLNKKRNNEKEEEGNHKSKVNLSKNISITVSSAKNSSFLTQEKLTNEAFVVSVFELFKKYFKSKLKEDEQLIIEEIQITIKQYLPKDEFERNMYVRNNKIYHRFNTSMNSKEFLILFCLAIDFFVKFVRKPTNQAEHNITKRIMVFTMKYRTFLRGLFSEDIVGEIKRDNILALLTYEQNDFSFSLCKLKFQMNNISDYFTFFKDNQDIEGFQDIIVKKEFPELPFNEELSILNRDDLKYIVGSQPILEVYNEALKIQGIATTTETIKIILDDFITNMKVYVIDIKEFGFTLYNGNIFLREDMVSDVRESYGNAGCTLLTLIHEFGHCIKRLLVEDSNFYLNTETMIVNEANEIVLKQNNEEKQQLTEDSIKDFGFAVENILYNLSFKAKKIGANGGKYLLKKESYLLNKNEFIGGLVGALKKDANTITGTYALNRGIESNLPVECL